MKVVNIGNIAEAYICDDLPAMGIVIEATLDELERLPNLTYKEVTISATPRRNCDVGTLEDRRERFKQFCKSHSSCVACDRNCPLFKLHINGYSCHFEWGELPFESEA